MNRQWEEEREFQNNVVQMQRWQRRAKYKFGAVVILLCVAAAMSLGLGMAISSVLGV